MEKLTFKLEYTIRELRIANVDKVEFIDDQTDMIRVEIRAPSKEEKEKGHKEENAFCTAYISVVPPSDVLGLFNDIDENKILTDDQKRFVTLEYNGPRGVRVYLPSLSGFPKSFQDFHNSIHSKLSERIKHIIGLVRWRFDVRGPHDPISTRGISWSRNNADWYPMPANYSIRIMDQAERVVLGAESISEIQAMFLGKEMEPTYHELFREAWNSRFSNPRSSLVIGVTSLEVATKQTVAHFVNKTTWLMENIPSPPIDKLIVEYLPTLHEYGLVEHGLPKKNDDRHKDLKKIVGLRNKIAHIGVIPLSGDKVEGYLVFLKGIIDSLDLLTGHAWVSSRREMA